MSTVYSVGYTKVNANQKTSGGEWGARLRYYYDEYEALNLAAASTIYMFMPAKGHRYAGFGQLAWDDLSGTGTYTIGVGIVGATGAFLVATTNVVAAADKADLDADAGAIIYLGYEFDGDTPVILTTAGAATDATGTIKLGMAVFAV